MSEPVFGYESDHIAGIYWAEILPGMLSLMDDTAWHPLLSKSYRDQPDRMSRPCYGDPKPPEMLHFLDRKLSNGTRLRDGFYLMGY